MLVYQHESMASRKLDDKKWTKIYTVLRMTTGLYTKNEAKTRHLVEFIADHDASFVIPSTKKRSVQRDIDNYHTFFYFNTVFVAGGTNKG